MNGSPPDSLAAVAFDNIPGQVAVLDMDGVIRATNHSWDAFGSANGMRDDADVVGQNYLAACQPSPDGTAEDAADGIESVIAGRTETFSSEYPCHSPDERRWFSMRATRFEFDGDRLVLVVHSDITARRQAEAETADRNETLEMVAGIMSHDLRNPLSVALARAAMIDHEQARVVERSIERMNDIIDDALVLARESEPETLDVVDVEQCARDAWDHVRTDDAALVVAADATVETDASLLRQLFENLFRNAVEHGSTGSRTPSDDAVEDGSTGSDSQGRQDAVEHGTTSPESQAQGDTPDDDSDAHAADVVVTVDQCPDGFVVADDGPGIPSAKHERVFEPGYTTNQQNGGTGLGLTIVRRVAEVHDWSVSVDDGPDGGAMFSVTDVDRIE